jgi:hypothetical protein
MNTFKYTVRGLVAAAVLVLSACASPRASAPDPVRAEAYSFEDGAGSTGSVFRAIAADGAEALHGVTDVITADGARRIVEDATLDAQGRLVRAEIVVTRGEGGAIEEHVQLDRARGTIRAATPGGTVEWPAPLDAPWAIEPLARGAATPIAAWIGARAAASNASVRVIRADQRTSYRAPAEQVAIPHELGATVILGDASAEADASFVRGVRPEGGSALTRRDHGVTALSCASAGAPDVMW